MTEDQFAAHNRDLLAWVLDSCPIAQRLAHDAPEFHDWTGSEVLHAAGTDRNEDDVQFTFSTEFRSGRVVGRLKATFADGSAEWEGTIPRDVVKASNARVMGC